MTASRSVVEDAKGGVGSAVDNLPKLSVLFAAGDPQRSPCAAQLRAHPRVATVRPCADLSDLLTYAATAGTGLAIVDLAQVPDLDRSAIAAIERYGLRVVGLAQASDGAALERLRRLGLATRLRLVEGRCDPGVLDEAIRGRGPGAERGAGRREPTRPGPTADPWPRPGRPAANEASALGPGEPVAPPRWQETTLDRLLGAPPPEPRDPGAGPQTAASADDTDGADDTAEAVTAPGRGLPGPIVAVWGPTGAPGRTTVASALAREFALSGLETLLVDADSYGGAIALRLGMLDEVSTLATAVRLADAGRLDEEALVGPSALAVRLPDGVRVLTGIADPARWPQLRPAGLEAVLGLAAEHLDRVVVDCGFCLEQDEELSYDTAAPRRNGATLAVLARADAIVAVGTGDPVGAARLQAGLGELALLAPSAPITVLLNRVGEGGRRTRAARQLAARLRAAVPCLDVRLLPDDPGEEGPLRRALGAWIHGPAVTGDLGSRDPRP